MTTAKWTESWRLFWLLSLILAAMALGLLFATGWTTEGYRLVIRATARTSLILFLAAFAASAAARLWPGAFTHWLRRNRRQFGLSFAMSHLIHALAIFTLWGSDPDTFWRLSNKGSIVSGGIAYLFIAALAVTSFDAAVQILGPKAWGCASIFRRSRISTKWRRARRPPASSLKQSHTTRRGAPARSK